MIVNQLPHTARYIPCTVHFAATFNAPVVGVFSFDPATNTDKEFFKMQLNTWYLIESITWTASVAGQDYTAALQSTAPLLTLTRGKNKTRLYPQPRPLAIYEVNGGMMSWINSDVGGRKSDAITGTLSGQLNMTPALVGVTTINVVVSLNVYAVDGAVFDSQMRNGISANAAQIQRGAL